LESDRKAAKAERFLAVELDNVPAALGSLMPFPVPLELLKGSHHALLKPPWNERDASGGNAYSLQEPSSDGQAISDGDSVE
jgi:hypothetical protein